MLEHFADWYREAGIEPSIEKLPKHREVIENYRPSATEIIALARAFYGFAPQDDPGLTRFLSALTTADPILGAADIGQLLSMLSGAALVSGLRRRDELADLSALSIVSGAAQGLRNALPVVEIPNIAANYIKGRASSRAMTISNAESLDEDAKLAAIKHELAVVSEETNMLWWLISGFSRDLDVPWTTVGSVAAPVIAGKELADLTKAIPGPGSAVAFLDRVISGVTVRSKDIKVTDVIDATPREWRFSYFGPSCNSIDDLAPISAGMRLSLAVDNGEDWSNVFRKGARLPAAAKLRPAALGYQMYLERLLTRLTPKGEERDTPT